MDILKTNRLKTHTDPNTVRARPTPKMSSVFGTGPRTRLIMGSHFSKQHNLQNAVFYEYEDRFEKIAKMSSYSEWIVDAHESKA